VKPAESHSDTLLKKRPWADRPPDDDADTAIVNGATYGRASQLPRREGVKSMQRLARAATTLQAVLLVNVYSVWFYMWRHVGYRPQYGKPESWSTSPLDQHGYLLPFAGLSGMAIVAAAFAGAVVLGYRAAQPNRTRSETAWALLAIGTSIMAVSDPAGALEWYLD
jgi:hypothetical protein